MQTTEQATKSDVEKLKVEFDNFMVYVQKYIEENLNVLSRTVVAEYRSVEDKMDAVEWTVRYADYISNDEIQKFYLVYRDIYASMDKSVRNGYIKANHLNDSILYVCDQLARESNKLDHQF